MSSEKRAAKSRDPRDILRESKILLKLQLSISILLYETDFLFKKYAQHS